MDYDALIIGAGLSGLACGIRLAHFDKKVCIVESHTVVGGLNSFYRRGGRTIDVGLHAMTNYVPPAVRDAPLPKLLRQLRLRREDLALVEQSESRIAFPHHTLRFSNHFELLSESVREQFPSEIDSFLSLDRAVRAYDAYSLDASPASARRRIASYLRDPILVDMLLTPLMYYGNPAEDDMDWMQFCIMWKSIYHEGLARPERGMVPLLELLVSRFRESGGELRLGVRVEKMESEGRRIRTLRLSTGEILTGERIFSSAGWVETFRLITDQPADVGESEIGSLSFVEWIGFFDIDPALLGGRDAVLFFNDHERLRYRQPLGLVDLSSGVLCIPNRFHYPTPLPEGCVRLTLKASYPAWRVRMEERGTGGVSPSARERYAEAKRETEHQTLRLLERFLPGFRAHLLWSDLFTPLTIERYTGHLRGAVYGSPVKHWRGETAYENLFLIGTDQGFLGIVGALLSGITMANRYGLP